MAARFRSPMKHPSLQHLPRKERWFRLQQFNGTWIAGVGLLLFMVVGGAVYLAAAMLLVATGLTRALQGPSAGAIATTIAAVPALAAGALAWEILRRAAVNRALDSQSRRCPCGYDTSTLTGRCPECGRDIP
jgi:hypothetical protein